MMQSPSAFRKYCYNTQPLVKKNSLVAGTLAGRVSSGLVAGDYHPTAAPSNCCHKTFEIRKVSTIDSLLK